MKILHIVPAYFPAIRYGGPIKSVHELNKWLVKNGADVAVYTTNIDGLDNLNVSLGEAVNIDGVKVFYFPISFRPWKYSFAFHRILAKNIKDFDLIHITSVFLAASTLGAYYAKKFKKPYIISPRGSFMEEPLKYYPLKKKIYISLIEKRNLAGAEAIHFTVEKEKNDYLKLNIPLKKTIIIPNGIDFSNYINIDPINNFREKFGISKDRLVVLFMGRLHKIKGLDTLIPAFAEVIKKEPKAILVLAGPDDDGYGEKIKLQITNYKLKIGKDVIFVGMILGEDKIAAYRESDIFVLSSYSENFGMAVVEAMIVGKPVVVTKGVGISKEVEAAGAGLVVEKDVSQIADAILKFLENPQIAAEMGRRGRELVEKEFSSEKVAEKWIEEYNKILQNYEK
ncbi:MAG: glycosyltransferase [Patescibacteria group bacterium]